MPYCLKMDKVRSYYKYTDTAWTQPTFSSNGTMGSSEIAVTCDTSNGSLYGGGIWSGFAGNGGWIGQYADEYYAEIHIHIWTRLKLILTGVDFESFRYSSSSNGYPAKNVAVWGSNDNMTWNLMLSDGGWEGGNSWRYYRWSNSTPYNYHMLRIGNAGHSYSDEIAIRGIKFYGTKEKQSVIGSPTDYDYYVESDGYYLPYSNNKFYVIN